MNDQQFNNLIAKVWSNMALELTTQFNSQDTLKFYFNKYHELAEGSGPGAIVGKKNLLEVITGVPRLHVSYFSLEELGKLTHNTYDTSLSVDPNVAYVVMALIMTGPKEFFSGAFLHPNARVSHVLVTIKKEEDNFTCEWPKHFTVSQIQMP